MPGNYFRIAIRVLTRNWTYTLINIFGLGFGLAACLAILLYVRYELSYDSWLPDADRVYQLQTKIVMGAAHGEMLSQMATYPAGVALKKDFQQIERLVHAQMAFPSVVHSGLERRPGRLFLVDGPFFDIIGLPLLEGDPNTALAEAGSIVLTQSEAAK